MWPEDLGGTPSVCATADQAPGGDSRVLEDQESKERDTETVEEHGYKK